MVLKRGAAGALVGYGDVGAAVVTPPAGLLDVTTDPAGEDAEAEPAGLLDATDPAGELVEAEYMTVDDEPAAPDGTPVSVAVTGQMVVYSMTSVVTDPILAGQSVTVGAQEITVYTEVVVKVDVVLALTEAEELGACEEAELEACEAEGTCTCPSVN